MLSTEVSVGDVLHQSLDVEECGLFAELLAVGTGYALFVGGLEGLDGSSHPLLLRQVELGSFVIVEMGSIVVPFILARY